jgi:hypothetical protein
MPASKQSLTALFKTLKDNIRVVILNACYSHPQAQAITKVIDCAIGMNTAIGDLAAITFAASFYRAIGFGRSLQEAFEQGKTALLLENIPEENTPELVKKRGIDPSQIILINSLANSVQVKVDTDNSLKGRVDELIDILSSRAEVILDTLSEHFKYVKIKSYYDKFKGLHERHIEALRKGNIIHAHEVLTQIHNLSNEIESDEFWTSHRINRSGMRYSLRHDAFQSGMIISGYVTGDMRSYSPKFLEGGFFSQKRFVIGEYSAQKNKLPQTNVIEVYQKILALYDSASEKV